MFFFTVEYDSEIEVNAVLDKSGTIFFKALDVLHVLGYKKPAEAVRTHVPNACSLDVLLSRNGNVMDIRLIPFPTNAKVLSPAQVHHLLSKLKRPSERFNRWFSRILQKPLKSNEDVEFLRKLDFDRQCPRPRFYLHPEGNIWLCRLKAQLSRDVKPEMMDLEPQTVSIGVNTDVVNPILVLSHEKERDFE